MEIELSRSPTPMALLDGLSRSSSFPQLESLACQCLSCMLVALWFCDVGAASLGVVLMVVADGSDSTTRLCQGPQAVRNILSRGDHHVSTLAFCVLIYT